jgi:O-antigen/teichoic acid export membrane protein
MFKYRIIKATSQIFLANLVIGICGIISISIIAKSLDILEFGYLAIIQAYTMTINGLVNFQTWRTVVKYFPESKSDRKCLYSLLKYSYMLDILTAILAFILAIFLLPFVKHLIQLNIKSSYVYIYLLVILFNIQGTAVGYFRSIDKNDIFILVGGINSILKVITIYLISILAPNLRNFILTQVLFVLTYTLFLNYIFIKENGTHIMKQIFYARISIIKNKFPDIKEFSIFTSLTGSFDLVFKQGDVLIVSTFFGAHYAGIFKMLKTIGGLIQQIINPIYLSLYPIISEKKNNIFELKKIVNKTIFYLLIIALIGGGFFYIINKYLIDILFGEEYICYSNYLLLYIIPIIISGIFTAVHPAFNLLGYHRENLYLLIVTSILYLIGVFLMKDIIGFKIILYMLILHGIIITFYKYIKIMRRKV